MNDMTIRIAIGCHSYLLGEGIKKLFREEDGIDVIGIFDEGIDIKEILKLTPDIILADFKIFRSFPDEFPEDNPTKILLISDRSWLSESERQIPELLTRGVFGILAPDADSQILRKAVKVVYAGELWLDRKLIKDVLYNMTHVDRKIDLTRKEKEIVSLICHGYRNKEIAQKLSIAEQTVKSHCNRIFKKVGVSDRLQLALYTHKIWPGHI
ncbi:MAG TPA: response regulator transcription factor [Thermodesulfovibrionales bacterium]|jgi:DNA-binding NarL/FixJ family response regulator|nr:response regulator transcription factor [Thermodesulfovibrionales bacterium]HZV46116.1 response regulator transcription factor [Thermodesulfovibrionales bacterium]